MSRFVNWSIALLLRCFSQVIVFAPALEFNYLTAVPWPGFSNDPPNHTKSHEQCHFVWFHGSSSMLSRSQNLGIGTLLRRLFSCFASGRIVYSKTRKSSARPALPIHSTAIPPSALKTSPLVLQAS